MLPNLKRLMNSKMVGSLAVAMSLTIVVPARGQGDDSPPPLLRGGLVHQLRSLSEEALDSLQLESSSGPAARAGRTAQPPKGGIPKPPQPSGRATLQRTHASPWIERFQEPAGPAMEELPRSQSFVEPTSGSGLSNKPIPLRDPPARAARSTTDRSLPAAMPSQNSRAQRPNVEANNNRPLAPVFSGAALKAAQQTAVPAIPEVHVAESLPPEVRQSISPLSDSTESSPEVNSKDTEAIDSEAENKPQVSRVPLPRVTGGPARQQAGGGSRNRIPQIDASIANSQATTSQATTARPDDIGVPAALTSSQLADRSVASVREELGESNLPAFPSASADAPTMPTLNELPSFPEPTAASPEPVLSPDTSALPVIPMLPLLPDIPSLPSNQQTQPMLPIAALPTGDASNSATNVSLENTPPTLVLGQSKAPEIQRGEPSAYTPAPVRAQAGRANDETERLRMETPRIAVLLEGPEDLPVGQPADYVVRVINQDSISLSGLVLRLDVPAGVATRTGQASRGELQVERAPDATLLTWMFEGLEPGGIATAPIQLTAQSARNFGLAMEWTIVPVTGSTGLAVLAPALELMLEGPAEVVFGEANTYRLRVKNPGSADARNVAITLSAESYGASSSDIATVRAGGEEVVDIELTFNQEGSINIAASAKADSDLNSATRIDVLVQRANLVASVDVPALVYHGTQTDYIVRVANTGNALAKDVRASMRLPVGAKLINLPNDTQLADGVLSWDVGEVAPGAAADLPMQLCLLSEGENELTVECRSASGLTANCVSKTIVKAVSDLKLFVTDPIAPAPIGSEVIYELTLTNRGSKAATGVRVIAQFSEGIEPVRGEGTKSRVVPGQVIFEPLQRIEPGETVKLKVVALADDMGTHRFRAEVRTDDTSVRLVQEASTAFLEGVGRIAAPTSGRPMIR